MKVHPTLKKQNMTISQKYDVASFVPNSKKKLKRLPHVFSKVLELPLHSNTDVSIQETSDSFRFIVAANNITGDVKAHTIEIYPGVSKVVVVRRTDGSDHHFLSTINKLDDDDEKEVDLWRFRLPASTRPEMASAVLCGGELVITVPKGVSVEDIDIHIEEDHEQIEVWGEENGRIVLVE